MKTTEQLINSKEPGWPIVKGWIDSAKNKVVILPCDKEKAKEALYHTQVTTRSPMGAIIYATGGLLVDHGWVRILGSGSKELKRSLPDWNKGKTFQEFGDRPSFLLVADDAAGGFFALNGGAVGTDTTMLYYLAPDDLQWHPMSLSYSEFLDFCFNGNLVEFYEGIRWLNWKDDLVNLDADKVYNFYPTLWSEEGKELDLGKALRTAIPAEAQYKMNMNFRKQKGIDREK